METLNECRLTPREREVVAGVLRGESNNSIASRLSITTNTVKHHLTSVFTKVGVGTRLQLALVATTHTSRR